MRDTKKKRLEAAGWKIGSVKEFLDLSTLEAVLVELRLRLAEGIRVRRQRLRLTQMALAKRIGSSQSRVAKMEAGDPTVTVDLMLRALLSIGASREDLADLIRDQTKRVVRKTGGKKKARPELAETAG